jgi:hypothetical protein
MSALRTVIESMSIQMLDLVLDSWRGVDTGGRILRLLWCAGVPEPVDPVPSFKR